MPEGDTVHLAATRLRAALVGKTLTRTDFRVPRYATLDLSGRILREVVPRGKHLLFRIDGGVTLHTHFKMEGSWHLYRTGAPWRGPEHQVRAVLTTDEWTAVGFRLAITEVIETDRETEAIGHLGPDVLGPDWDPDEVLRRLRHHPQRAIAEVLLDQEVLAGPGNVYKCEVCFLRGLYPWMPVAEVPDLEGVIGLVKRLMEANRTTGNQITTGDTRRGRTSWVYGRAGEPCRRCRTPVRRAAQRGYGGERVTYWCPSCQPAPTQP